jgi:hypothetical protein
LDIKFLHGLCVSGGHFPVGGEYAGYSRKPGQINSATKVVNRHHETSWMVRVPVMFPPENAGVEALSGRLARR